jgi:hypothetical protein
MVARTHLSVMLKMHFACLVQSYAQFEMVLCVLLARRSALL